MFLDFLSFIIGKCIFFCSAIAGDTFPKPLPKKEEEELIERMQSGDRVAREKLISHNLRLVAHVVKKYQGVYDNDDLISVGTIGLIKAVDTFKPGKGSQLATYTAKCIENEILMLLRANKKHKMTVSLSDVIGADKDGNELTLIDLLADDDNAVTKVERTVQNGKFLEFLRTNLNDREFKILVLRYGLKGGAPLTQREVSSLLKISRSYVSRIEKKSIDKLKKTINKNQFYYI